MLYPTARGRLSDLHVQIHTGVISRFPGLNESQLCYLAFVMIRFFLPDVSKSNVPEDFDIDMEDPETEKAAVTIQSQFRKFQKKKRDEKS